MKKYLFVSCLLLSIGFAKAQEAVSFKIKFLPNHTYQIASNSSIAINTDLSANKDLVDKLASQGIKQPIAASVQYSSSATGTTGALAADNSFPISLLTNSGATPGLNVTVNGKQIPIPMPKKAAVQFYGHVSADGKLNVDSLSGKKLDDSSSAPIKKMMNNMMGAINFPEHPLKIGETFTFDAPFNMPIAGKGMAMNIKVTYKLVSISGNNAYFDLVHNLDMQLDMKGMNASITGTGTGKMVYDIKNSYPSTLNSDMKMFITLKSDKFNAVATANVISNATYTIN
jgi:hypothetical protein